MPIVGEVFEGKWFFDMSGPKNKQSDRVPSSVAEVGSESRVARLKRAVDAAGGREDVARRSKVPVSTLGGYLSGGEMKLSNAEALADATGVRLEWLATGRGPMHAEAVGSDLVVPGASSLTTGVVEVARYDTRASAGRRGLLSEGRVVERIQLSEEWVRLRLRRDPKHLAILEAWGDSMEPTIGDGDVLMLDIQPDGLVNGRIYVLDVAGELLVKRVRRRMNGNVVMVSDNTRYPEEELAPSELDPIRIIGEVVWHGRVV